MKHRLSMLAASALISSVMIPGGPARADDYTDLLTILHARGSLSNAEYRTLLNKHLHKGAAASSAAEPEMSAQQAAADARRNAMTAAASAAAVDAAMRKLDVMKSEMHQDMLAAPELVHVEPYKPGAGVTVRVGSVDLNFSGIVNGFYTYSSADSAGHTPAGGLADGSGFDSSSVRNGLLPGAFIFTASTHQEGFDVSATFGVYPGINSSNTSPLGANSGGNATALNTAGGDFRKMFLTVGNADLGTVKIGRDIAIFGSDAILNDATLLSVGATGGNADPANTSLGRIGLGYIYTDFMPQISYATPVFAGFQADIGVFQPLNEFNFSGLSSTADQHSTPELEGKVTYDFKSANFTAHLWAGFMGQNQQNIQPIIVTSTASHSKFADAGEGGAALTLGPVGLTGYIYRGSGVGTTGKFFDGIAPNGQLRDSEGGYIQASYKLTPRLKLVGSYGESSLYLAPGEYDPTLVRRNEAEVAAAYYQLTDWVTLVGEYAHEESKSHGPLDVTSNAVSAGAILFY